MATATLTDGFPLTEADGVTGRNNGHDLRKGFLASILLPDTKTDPLAVRNGVFPHDFDSKGVKSLRVDAKSTADATILLNAGACVSERAGQGPYLGWLETSAGISFQPTGANPSNPRIDVLYVLVTDASSIGTDTSTNTTLYELNGTPSATPTVPAITADGAVKLCEIYRPANDSTITAARITDRRRSTGLVGSNRIMLPGDLLSDPGKVSGEFRFRAAAGSLPAQVDFWDAAQGLWRGTQGFTVTQALPGTPNSGSIVSGSSTSKNNQLVVMTIPDPGFPYRLAGSAALIVNTNSGSANVYMNANAGPLVSTILNTADGARSQLQPSGGTVFTGTSTVKLCIDIIAGGTSMSWGADVRNLVTVQVIPA